MIKTLNDLLAQAREGKQATIAVAAAHDYEVLRAVSMARKEKIAASILVGKEEKIAELLRSMGEKPESYRVVPAETDEDCARTAVELVALGKADFLMKGLIPTATLMRAVLDKERGLRGQRLISHVMLYEAPSYPKLLFLTDGGMNTYPDLEKKADILENAAQMAQTLGYEKLYACCVCGAEEVNPKIQATVDAKALSEMEERWKPYHMVVNGPMGLDLAISKSACEHKRYTGEAGGRADILLVPTYEVGNGIGKAMTYFAGARMAGLIVGAQVPIVLVSRSDTAETKLYSIALGCLVARGAEAKQG